MYNWPFPTELPPAGQTHPLQPQQSRGCTVIKYDEDFERIKHEQKYNMRDKRISKQKRVGEPLSVTYSIKLTQSQRIALMRLGPEWIREQIDKVKQLPEALL